MKELFYLFILCFLFTTSGFSQITVDEEQLSESLKEKLIEDITAKITSSVEQGEKWVADAIYFSTVLEPFERFGIDPSNPNFLNQAYDIHKKVQEEIEKNPGLRYSSQLNVEIKGMVKNGLWNYASSYIDKDSKEIYEQVTALISNGTEQISKLLDAASGISNLNSVDDNYESKVTAILTKYGIQSEYFFIIDDLDQILSAGYDKIAEPISALTTVVSAVRSNDPVYKIDILFELGETYGGKVPVIGNLITPIFKMGKGVLDAAKRLEGVLEKNLNQGCIIPGATYGSINENKRTSFIRKFPQSDRVCPMNQDVYSPVYNNIYVSESDKNELYFYLNNTWLRGKKDSFHAGTDDIYATIQWLRRNGLAEKATDLDFVFTTFQKEYGWLVYTREIAQRTERIKTLFLSSYSAVQHCDDENLRIFFMEKMDLNWLVRLLKSGEIVFNWEDAKSFSSYWEKEIADQMIRNYFLGKHQHNLNNLDNIIQNLKRNIPVNIYGFVAEGNGPRISGATIQQVSNFMFETESTCHKITTGPSGTFSFYLLMNLENQANVQISALTPDHRKITENVMIDPVRKRYYEVNLITPYVAPDDYEDDEQDSTLISVSERIANSDCAKDPLAIAEWDAVNEIVICTCIDEYIWNETTKKCEPNIQLILDNSDCSKWPYTEAKWDAVNNEPYCDCIEGFEWNNDFTKCLSKQEILISQADCSHYQNSHPVWDAVNQQVICDCLPGYEWNEDYTRCISKATAGVNNINCSFYPNTEPIWDPVNEQAYCDCLPGYEWNEDYTGCEPMEQEVSQQINYDCSFYPNTEPVFDPVSNIVVCDCLPGFEWNNSMTACVPMRNKPNIDWDNIINITMDVINAASGIYPGTMNSPGGGTSGTLAQQPVTHQSNCNDQQQAGGDAPEIHNINLGQSFGTFVFDYDVYDVKDQIIITQGGSTIFNTGCISKSKSTTINLNGLSNQITVRVNPNCDGHSSGTQWNFTVHCPRN